MLLVLLLVVIALAIVLPIIGLTVWALFSIGLVGLIIGGLARLVLPGEQRIGLLGTVLLGWIGSLVGGFLGNHVLGTGWLLTVLLEIAAAALLIALYSGAQGRSVTGGSPRRALHW